MKPVMVMRHDNTTGDSEEIEQLKMISCANFSTQTSLQLYNLISLQPLRSTHSSSHCDHCDQQQGWLVTTESLVTLARPPTHSGVHILQLGCILLTELRKVSATSGVGKVRPAGQIWPTSSVHPARGGSSVLTLNSARKTMSDCFHAERDLVAHW